MSHFTKFTVFKRSLKVGLVVFISAFSIMTQPALAESGASSAQVVQCTEHGIDQSKCFICDPSLREKGRLWCKEHSRYEDRCWLCHPDMKEAGRLFCEEHSLYEDECVFCHPEVAQRENDPVLFCKEHEIDQSKCFICDPSLREKGRLWCKEHSRYEDRCWLCHPDMKEAGRLFCEEHSLYEDECIFCHPEIAQGGDDLNKPLPKDRPVLFCNEHQVTEEECGICQPQLAAELTPGQSLKVRFPSKQSADKAGLRTTIPSECLSASTVEAFCEVKYNENALARITPLASGVIQRVLADIGGQVEAGDVLVEVNSVEIAEAKASYLSAIADVQVKRMASEREEKLVTERISATRDYQEAKASYDIAVLAQGTARQRLLNYGFSDAEIKEIEKMHDSSSLFAVRAPFRGTLIARTAVIGEVVNPGEALFTVANLENMWMELSIPAHQTSLMKQGLDVEARFDTRIELATKGELIWVATSIDERSRMLKARALIPNEDGWIKAGMFGKAAVAIDEAARGFRIPKEAIQYIDDKPFVFVKEEADLFALRRVALGTVNGSHADVLSGINAADQVVTQGSFIAFSEFFKSRLGAGCVDD